MPLLDIFKTIDDLVFIADESGAVIEVNPAFASTFGAPRSGQSVVTLWPEIAGFWKSAIAANASGKQLRVDIPGTNNDGRYLSFDVRISVIDGADTAGNSFVGIARDVTSERATAKNLELQAVTDPLTGAYNRGQLEVLLTQAIRSARRRKSTGCFLFFDIDNFKQINDSYGHVEGDRVLKEIASELLTNLRNSDVVARFGGDEFAAILTDSNGEAGRTKALQLVDVLNQIRPSESAEGIWVSIGIAVFPYDGDQTADIIKYADSAMYYAKGQMKQSVSAWGDGRPE